LIVPQDELLSFVNYFTDKIQIPLKWKPKCKYYMTKYFGADVYDLAKDLPFYPIKIRILPPSPPWCCGFARGRLQERLEADRPKFNYPTRIDIPRWMVQIKNDKFVRKILYQYLNIVDLANMCIAYL